MALRHKNNTAQFKRQRLRVLARDQYTCQYCGTVGATHCDHVIPKVDGGSDEMDNLVASCARCNQLKGSKSVGVFLGRRSAPLVFSDHLSPTTVSVSLPGPFEGQSGPLWN
ncbi:HNHc domain containing protein [uncultured Caudovirales phage]|uniref:HNHc domain containing protein n=1 Tax=uncultured Caudovirales phage TaxID=2100421 RepID=A0A6J5T2R1_9CAUD|nr:HNHc domain containing protein [uncultured Caudovirales phage]